MILPIKKKKNAYFVKHVKDISPKSLPFEIVDTNISSLVTAQNLLATFSVNMQLLSGKNFFIANTDNFCLSDFKVFKKKWFLYFLQILLYCQTTVFSTFETSSFSRLLQDLFSQHYVLKNLLMKDLISSTISSCRKWISGSSFWKSFKNRLNNGSNSIRNSNSTFILASFSFLAILMYFSFFWICFQAFDFGSSVRKYCLSSLGYKCLSWQY
jgi:hypothetical protein